MKRSFLIRSIGGVAAVALTVVAASAQHDEDFVVGADAAGEQIVVTYDEDVFPFTLPKSEEPLLAGFALDDPGFKTEGAEFPFGADAVVAMKVLATSSPEMKVWDPLAPGEDGFQIIGDTLWEIGSPEFDAHPWWHIDTADPNYNPDHAPWTVAFQLIDLNGKYGQSDEVTASYVPEPGAAFLLAAGLAVGGALRRRW